MSVTIWHNPRCSKSRATLKLLEERGIEPEVRLYLENAPDVPELRNALELIGIPPMDLVRRGEPEFREAKLSKASSEDEVIAAMAAWPRLIERPVVFANGKARVGRPPEAVLEIILNQTFRRLANP